MSFITYLTIIEIIYFSSTFSHYFGDSVLSFHLVPTLFVKRFLLYFDRKVVYLLEVRMIISVTFKFVDLSIKTERLIVSETKTKNHSWDGLRPLPRRFIRVSL